MISVYDLARKCEHAILEKNDYVKKDNIVRCDTVGEYSVQTRFCSFDFRCDVDDPIDFEVIIVSENVRVFQKSASTWDDVVAYHERVLDYLKDRRKK